ncbi:MAG: hypothetical protein QNJ44_00900 [Rhodobacter sp.]|nr:hypothetical protein [Rhodobacter sp.]
MTSKSDRNSFEIEFLRTVGSPNLDTDLSAGRLTETGTAILDALTAGGGRDAEGADDAGLEGLATLHVEDDEDREILSALAADGLTRSVTLNGDLLLAAGDERLLAIRRMPIPSTQLSEGMPAWTSGLAAERLIGPVRDAVGRDLWIHIFRRVRQIRFVRAAGEAPFLSVPHVQFPSALAPAPETDHDLGAGSLWLAASLFDNVPTDTYSGVRIASGTLRFSVPIPITGDEVVVPAGVNCAIEATLDPPGFDTAGVAAAAPGGDARDATFVPPDGLRVEISAAGAKIVASGPAKMGVFGEDIALTPAIHGARYLNAYNRLLVPMEIAEATFDATGAAGADLELTGSAPILGGGLALAAARISPAQLGEASGVGALMLELGPGLFARAGSETTTNPLDETVLMLDQLRLALTAPTARHDGRRIGVEIGDVDPPSRAEIGRAQSGTLRYFALAEGQEAVQFTAEVAIRPDLPRDVAGDRIPMTLPNAAVILARTGADRILALYGRTRPSDRRRCFQLKNALLRSNDPSNALLFGAFDGKRLTEGALWASYRLNGMVPTLPDPYAANVGLRTKRQSQGASRLVSRFRVAAGSRDLDFFLPGQAPFTTPRQENSNPLSTPGLSAAPRVAMSSDFALSTGTAGTAAAAAAEPNWPEAIGDALDFEQVPKVILLDVSSGAGQLGVALRPNRRDQRDPIGVASVAPTSIGPAQPFAISDLALEADARFMVLLTLPAVQWEPVVAVPPEIVEAPPFPERVVFLNSGVPTVIDVPAEGRVAIAPLPAYETILDTLQGDAHPVAAARFTLPFGMIAAARLSPPTDVARGARVSETRPVGDDLKGAPQLTLRAEDRTLGRGKTPALPGHAVQLPVAVPANGLGSARSVLGDSVSFIFNDDLGAASPNALVPVTRIDLSGYGESVFSKWINPKNAMTQVDKVELDVPVGRAGREVVQVRSILLPYGVPVVRTITLQRKADAIVGRSDSGWVAAGIGDYGFSGSGTVTHPGVVTRIVNVEEIRETGQRITADGQEFVAVYFQGDLILDGAADPVPVKRHLGYVRLTADPPAFGVATYQDLIAQAGPMCGPVDGLIAIGGGSHKMRIKRVGVAVSGTEFAMSAWGSLVFPGGGEWSVLESADGVGAPAPVPEDEGLPLIRQGAAGVATTLPYRFADPQDLLSVSPQKDYGILHSMGMQRVYYRRPRIDASEPDRIVSTEQPVIADPYLLSRATSVFPAQSDCIPFPTPTFALEAQPDGSYVLDGPGTFPAGLGRRTVSAMGSVSTVLDYGGSDVTYEVNTADPTPWRFELTNATQISAHSSMGDMVTTVAQIRSDGEPDSRFEDPQVMVGGAVQIVQDMLTILESLGIGGEPEVRMENKPKFIFGLRIPFVDGQGKDLQVPPKPDPNPFIIFADSGFTVQVITKDGKTKSKVTLGGSPMFAIKSVPGLYAVAVIKFSLIISEKDGTTFVVTIGFGVAYTTKLGPLKLKGLVAFTFIGIVGETVMGWGGGILVKAEAAIKPIVSVGIRFEAMGARLVAQGGTANETVFFVSKVSIAIDISLFLVLNFSVQWETKMVEITRGPLPKEDAPDVL